MHKLGIEVLKAGKYSYAMQQAERTGNRMRVDHAAGSEACLPKPKRQPAACALRTQDNSWARNVFQLSSTQGE